MIPVFLHGMVILTLLPLVLVWALVRGLVRALLGVLVGVAIIAGVIFIVGNNCEFDPDRLIGARAAEVIRHDVVTLPSGP